MNDEQIRDSMRQLAATAPNADIWPRISGQVESHKPNRAFWHTLKLRPVLVGLNAVAIALLLLLVFGSLSLNTLSTRQPAPSNQAATTPAQQAASALQQADNGQRLAIRCDQGRGLFCMTVNGTPVAEANITHTFTLTDFAQYMGSEPTFLLPAVASTNYRLVGEISTGFYSHQVIGTDGEPTTAVEPSRDQWEVSYRDSTNPEDIKDIIITTNVNVGQSWLLDNIGNGDTSIINVYGTGAPKQGGTSRYQRADRLIELYHNEQSSPQSQIAYVYFLNPNGSQRILTTYTIRASYNVSNDDLLKMADSIERVDPNHLERYQ